MGDLFDRRFAAAVALLLVLGGLYTVMVGQGLLLAPGVCGSMDVTIRNAEWTTRNYSLQAHVQNTGDAPIDSIRLHVTMATDTVSDTVSVEPAIRPSDARRVRIQDVPSEPSRLTVTVPGCPVAKDTADEITYIRGRGG